MIKSREIKKAALNKLSWKKALLVSLIFTLANIALSIALDFANNLTTNTPIFHVAVNIIYIALILPLSFGFISAISKLYKSEKVSGTTIFNDAVLNFSKTIAIFLRTILKILLPSVIIIIAVLGILFLTVQNLPITTTNLSGYSLYIILLYSVVFVGIAMAALPYVLSSYILVDNKEMAPKDILEQSATLMKDKKWDFVKLMLSFLGWFILLAVITAIANMEFNETVSNFVYWVGMTLLLPYLDTAIRVFYEETQDTIEQNTVETEE
jgi:uncharacterized membrane protein